MFIDTDRKLTEQDLLKLKFKKSEGVSSFRKETSSTSYLEVKYVGTPMEEVYFYTVDEDINEVYAPLRTFILNGNISEVELRNLVYVLSSTEYKRKVKLEAYKLYEEEPTCTNQEVE